MSSLPDDLAELLDACHRQEADAQRRLYREWYGFARSKALPYGRDSAAVEEIVQDAFVKLFNALRREVFRGVFAAWFRRIVVNAGIDHYRRERTGPVELLDAELAPGNVPNEAPLRLERDDCIRLLQRLPPACRMVFTLYVFEEYTHPEIGERLGISAGTSRAYLFRARELLRPLVGTYLHLTHFLPHE
ncbi:RNA polymerase sigma factor [Lewinella sp. IMCC34183]|uniref:RNA polymerase sigma factor n=1 Tax=Lewinella sp. IMCC34183 TaxID=2248762 RepID=UPI000E27F774|nr:sigma-70 family RNA polymerase sigma factor [Lewinella sp. IMCC34183]